MPIKIQSGHTLLQVPAVYGFSDDHLSPWVFKLIVQGEDVRR